VATARESRLTAGGKCTGEDDQKARQWLTTAAAVRGFTGFAVGRTTFWNPLVDYRAQKITRGTAVAQIAASYRAWVDLFEKAR
jgi:myo-inositol catabolism protein IolC